jgi:hypothetical protein
MKIEELTIGDLNKVVTLFQGYGGSVSPKQHPYQVGKAYFIRTVTHHFTGRLMAVYDQELVLEDAAWIADDGRFQQAVESGSFNEVEPFPDRPVIINRSSIIDVVEFTAKLPRSQK